MRPRLGISAVTAAWIFFSTAFAKDLLEFDVVPDADRYPSQPLPFEPYGSPLTMQKRDEDEETKSASPDGTAKQNSNGTLDWPTWDLETNEACVDALRHPLGSINPSGNCVCYNLPSLNANTGVFEADLRLYRILQARGDWARVSPRDMKVGVQFRGANVMPIARNQLTGSGMVDNSTRAIVARDLLPRDIEPQLLQTYTFRGQIDEDRLKNNLTMSVFLFSPLETVSLLLPRCCTAGFCSSAKMLIFSSAEIQAIVIPFFTLTARTSGGISLSANISLNDAAFVWGVFSKDVVFSDWSAALFAVNTKLDALRNGTVAFVLPGVQLMIFPIGLIITSVWLVLGSIAYGIGTYDRVRYARQYWRLAKKASSRYGSVAT